MSILKCYSFFFCWLKQTYIQENIYTQLHIDINICMLYTYILYSERSDRLSQYLKNFIKYHLSISMGEVVYNVIIFHTFLVVFFSVFLF